MYRDILKCFNIFSNYMEFVEHSKIIQNPCCEKQTIKKDFALLSTVSICANTLL